MEISHTLSQAIFPIQSIFPLKGSFILIGLNVIACMRRGIERLLMQAFKGVLHRSPF